jgi:hypothetical protein
MPVKEEEEIISNNTEYKPKQCNTIKLLSKSELKREKLYTIILEKNLTPDKVFNN